MSWFVNEVTFKGRAPTKSTLSDSDRSDLPSPGYGTKIRNRITQITNNIKIANSNDQNITIIYLMSRVILSVLNKFVYDRFAIYKAKGIEYNGREHRYQDHYFFAILRPVVYAISGFIKRFLYVYSVVIICGTGIMTRQD
jgi:hypothetical protein